MKSRFNSYLETIDVCYWRDLCKSDGVLHRYDKGEEFIKAGTVGRYVGYVESGALKYECYDESGTPHVIGLEFAGNFVCDFPFSLFGQKSRCSIIASSPSEIFCIPVSWVAARMKNNGRLREIILETTTEVFGMVYDRHIGLYTQTPQQRLNDLLATDPQLFQLYSLRDIASLLNIIPTHLSRLRKNV